MSQIKQLNLATLRVAKAVFLAFLLGGCSPSPAPETENNPDSDAVAAEEADADSYSQSLLDEGWRKGNLEIRFELAQAANASESTANGGQITSVWSTTITARTTQEVLVIPDLRVLVPDSGTDDERRSAMESSPYIIEEGAEPTVEGTVTNSLRFESNDPNANDYIRLTRTVNENGKVSDLSLTNMHPSLYGKGHEVSLRLEYETQRETSLQAVAANGGLPLSDNNVSNPQERIELSLFPAPNADGLNNYPYIEESLPEDLQATVTKQHLDTLAMLQQLMSDAAPVQFMMRAGLVTYAESDKLVLEYNYSGNKQIPYMAGIEGFIGTPSPNTLKITISLTAGK
ncbi:MAG: hypothetical protein B0W54_20165 [Cellvibrio sp. 79]|nr:MAG: hypothetical protein B0W54_20165 [Cellvibrio sp. 79]